MSLLDFFLVFSYKGSFFCCEVILCLQSESDESSDVSLQSALCFTDMSMISEVSDFLSEAGNNQLQLQLLSCIRRVHEDFYFLYLIILL